MEGGTSSVVNEEDELLDLPPGFRFHPTDEEIIVHYLIKKITDKRFQARAIGEADLNKVEPWDLPSRAKLGEKEWFFFCQRDRKYPTGTRTNRATESGYWKATGKDKEIYMKGKNTLIGMKKTLVFYKGRAPKGEKSNWVMHEYRLEGNFPQYNFSRAAKEEWVVCKVFHKTTVVRRIPDSDQLARVDSFMEHLLESPTLPALTDYTYEQENSGFIDEQATYKGSSSSAQAPDFPTGMNYHVQDMQQDQKTMFIPTQMYPFNNAFQASPSNLGENYMFTPNISIPQPSFPYKSSLPIGYTMNSSTLVFKEKNQGMLSPAIRCKVENFSSNSMVSQSQETGLSTEITNEITSIPSMGDIESKKPFDDLDSLDFGHNISDLDSLWR